MNESHFFVLVVDDNPGDRALVRALLREGDDDRYVVHEADGIESARERLRSEAIDLVLLDLGLGTSVGLDTLRRFVAGPGRPLPPIVVHSGMQEESVALAALAEGAVDYVIKGEETGRSLRRVVRMAIERRRLSDAVLGHERARHQSESRLRTASELVQDALIALDPAGVVLEWNPGAASLFEQESEEAVGRSLETRLPELDDILPRIRYEDAGGAPAVFRTMAWRPLGEAVEVEISGYRRKTDQADEFVLSIRDLSATEEARRTIERISVEYELLLNSAGQGITGLDAEGHVTFTNPVADRVLCLGSQAPSTNFFQHLAALRSPDDSGPPISLAEVLVDGRPRTAELALECAGRRLFVRIEARALIRDSAIEGAVLVAEDLSERRELEDQLRHAQKMEVIGQLAGGIAHDFNNELAVIGLNTSMIQRDLEAGRVADLALVHEVREATARATRITRQLLNMSRKAALDIRVADLRERLDHLLKLFRKLMPESISLRTELADGTFTARIDDGALEQALLNLCTNARDAMEAGGTLTLGLETVDIARRRVLRGPLREFIDPGRWHRIDVVDDGVGMDRETLARILEPFFTTKPKNRGTGLGLPMVYGIVSQLGGAIEVVSTPGVGTRFSIYLPATSQRVDAAAADPLPWTGNGSGFTVLVVEDEAPLRKAVGEMFRHHGFQVVEAAHGREAIDVFERCLEGVDVVVSDNVMPEMSGIELHHALRDRFGPVPFVLTTGYSDTLLEGMEGVPVVTKPWQFHTMLDAVWGELHRMDASNQNGS